MPPLTADDDRLLPFALDENRRIDFDETTLRDIALDDDRDSVRQLIAETPHQFFANDFTGNEPLGAIGDLIRWKQMRSNGQTVVYFRFQLIESRCPQRRYRDDCFE